MASLIFALLIFSGIGIGGWQLWLIQQHAKLRRQQPPPSDVTDLMPPVRSQGRRLLLNPPEHPTLPRSTNRLPTYKQPMDILPDVPEDQLLAPPREVTGINNEFTND